MAGLISFVFARGAAFITGYSSLGRVDKAPGLLLRWGGSRRPQRARRQPATHIAEQQGQAAFPLPPPSTEMRADAGV